MAKKKEETGLVPLEPLVQVDPRKGMEGVRMTIPVITYIFTGQSFQASSPIFNGKPRAEEFNAAFFRLEPNKRRNFEAEYDQNNPVAPACFSADGINGSRRSEERDFSGEKKTVYGNCKSCYFSRPGTDGIWKTGSSVRAGIQCKNYALAFGMIESGVPIVLQIPPTGSYAVQKAISDAVMNIPGAGLTNLLWNVLPTGGGKKGDYMTVAPVRGLNREEYEALMALEERMTASGWIDQFIERFLCPSYEEADSSARV